VLFAEAVDDALAIGIVEDAEVVDGPLPRCNRRRGRRRSA
jgi:hypothetical protein